MILHISFHGSLTAHSLLAQTFGFENKSKSPSFLFLNLFIEQKVKALQPASSERISYILGRKSL